MAQVNSSCLQSTVVRGAIVIFAALLTTSCGTVIGSVPMQDVDGHMCETSAGAYFLPKKHLSIQVTQDTDGKYYKIAFGEPKPYADRRQHYCLDYLASSVASDTVEIGRSSDGLLQKISTVADDKSLKIVEKIVDVGLIAVTGNPGFGISRSLRTTEGEPVLADFNFDPFDEPRLAEINTTLATYGYCIYVVRHTSNPQRMCSNPARYEIEYAPIVKARYLPPIPFEEGRHGILYRPDMTYEVVILRRRDPKSHDKWKIHQVKNVELPNIAPVLSIPIERSVFVKRETTLEFKDGVLQDVSIKKPSELLAFSEFPLKVAQAIVAVPSELIKVRIASTNNRERLINAQIQLIATQKAYAEEMEKLQKRKEQLGTYRQGAGLAPTRTGTIEEDKIIELACVNEGNECRERARRLLSDKCQPLRDDPNAAVVCIQSS